MAAIGPGWATDAWVEAGWATSAWGKILSSAIRRIHLALARGLRI